MIFTQFSSSSQVHLFLNSKHTAYKTPPIRQDYSMESKTAPKSEKPDEYKSYSIRWAIIFAAICLVVGAHVCWLAFSPVSYETSRYLTETTGKNVTAQNVNFLASIGFPFGFVFGLIAIFIFDSYGVYYPLMIGGWSATIGCIVRLIVIYSDAPSYTGLVIAQVFNSIGSPMAGLCSTKLAAVWFSSEQTTIANTMVATSIPLGVLAVYLISPLVITTGAVASDFQTLCWIYSVPVFLGTGLMTFALPFRYPMGCPATPPSDTAKIPAEPFFRGLKILATTPLYVLTVLSCGSGVAYG